MTTNIDYAFRSSTVNVDWLRDEPVRSAGRRHYQPSQSAPPTALGVTHLVPPAFPKPTRRAVEMTILRRLSVRERELMLLVAEGLSNKEVAGQLDISERTVETHLQSIFRKLGIRKRTRLAALVYKLQKSQLVDLLSE